MFFWSKRRTFEKSEKEEKPPWLFPFPRRRSYLRFWGFSDANGTAGTSPHFARKAHGAGDS